MAADVSNGGTRGRFQLGDWTVEPCLNRLSRDDESIQLELKVMDVLMCLAEHAGEVVSREFIADNTLTHAIAEIRRALGDDARHPTDLETIPRRGCQLTAHVQLAGQPRQGAIDY